MSFIQVGCFLIMLANLAPLVLLGGKFISCDMLVLAREHLSYNAQAFKGCCLCVTNIVFAYHVRVSMMAEQIYSNGRSTYHLSVFFPVEYGLKVYKCIEQ